MPDVAFDNMSHLDKLQAPAALAQVREDLQRHRKLIDAAGLNPREVVREVLDLGNGDALVQATVSFGDYWTAISDFKRTGAWWPERDQALVHLADFRRNGAGSGATQYALRVLNIPLES